MEVRGTGCCGVLELVDISTLPTPIEQLKYATYQSGMLYRTRRRPFVTFTGVVKRVGSDHTHQKGVEYGPALATYITEQGLGRVVTDLPEGINDNTRNTIKMWLWMPDYDALWTWADERRAEDAALAQQEAALKPVVDPRVNAYYGGMGHSTTMLRDLERMGLIRRTPVAPSADAALGTHNQAVGDETSTGTIGGINSSIGDIMRRRMDNDGGR